MSRWPAITLAFLITLPYCTASSVPTAFNPQQNVTYHGLLVDGVEKFLNIPYGRDTSGGRRFSPPEPYVFPLNVSTYNASTYGPVCPQASSNLSIAPGQEIGCQLWYEYMEVRSLYIGNINDPRHEPEGLIQQSVKNGMPVIFVAMNYRLNIFGFAVSEALKENNSLNVGFRDQRLALEWVQENIELFGGDPDQVTIFGYSSGGFSVGMQILAYGGTRPIPFHAGIMESTALEPLSASNASITTYNEVAKLTGCDTFGNPQSNETLACLRALPFEALLNFTIAQYTSALGSSGIYSPVVDGDFLPLTSSELVRQGLFPKIPVIIGWTEDDLTLSTPETIQKPSDTLDFIQSGFGGLTNDSVRIILSLYPSADFSANPSANLSSEFYRTAQIFRDIFITCPSLYLGDAMAIKYTADDEVPQVYYYIQNQTILSGYFSNVGFPGRGVSHSSDLPYVFANFGAYNVTGDIHPTKGDIELQKLESRSWSSFASSGRPSLDGKETLEDWKPGYGAGNASTRSVYVIGGPNSGLTSLEGEGATAAVARQRLVERCAFLNSPDTVKQLQY
uniref:Carboxylic ester hydrolase n=1 Tax=Moniliophthora roreri TaxID=221103 RepID=A0A0W0F3M1_MONRR